MSDSFSISRYLNIRSASSPRFFSDGESIAFLTNITGMNQVWKVKTSETEPSWPTQLTFGSERVQWIKPSPHKGDGRLLFGRDVGGNENAQIFMLSEDGSEETCLTEGHEGSMHSVGQWTEDGRILFSANRRHRGIFDAYVLPLGGEPELVWRNDKSGYLRNLAYSPDGSKMLAARMEASFRNRLFEVDVVTAEARSLSLTDDWARYSNPEYTDDGDIVMATDVDSDFMYIARLNPETLKVERLVDLNWDASFLGLTLCRKVLAYGVNVEGASKLHVMNLSSGETKSAPLGESPGVVSMMPSFSPDNWRLAYTYTSPLTPTDIYVWNLKTGETRKVTKSSHGGVPDSSFKAPELIHYPTFDKAENGETRMIPSWFYKPESVHKAPVIVLVHGGPEGQSRPNFDFRVQYFLQNGYAVFVPNVRGSTGYGKYYSHLDDVRKRMDSVADLAHGAHWLKEQTSIDGEKLVVCGGSYGGFMVLSSVTTYPDLWVAGIDTVGISNLATFLENTSEYRRGHREAEYGSLKHDREFLEEIAPINHIDKVTAPLMVIQGANDPRVPLSESEQMVKAMKRIGKTVEFLVFDDEGHGVARLKNKKVSYPAIIRFLQEHVINK